MKAIDQDNRDVSGQLLHDDDLYPEQPDVGNSALLTFAASHCNNGQQQTVTLHAKGYYVKVRDYKSRPDVAHLKKFRRPGAFIQFS